MNNIVILPDAHAPYYDQKAFSVAMKITKFVNPNRVIILGDWIDMYQFSKFYKDPTRVLQLQDDLDVLETMLSQLRKAAPKAFIQYLQGNHEERLIKWLALHPEISNLRSLKPENLFSLNKFNISYVVDYIDLYGYVITHGDVVRKDSSLSAKAQMEKYLTNGITGHSHRLGKYTKKGFSSSYEWIEAGCLSILNPTYMSLANWTHGMVVASVIEDKMFCELVEIKDGVSFFRGKTFIA